MKRAILIKSCRINGDRRVAIETTWQREILSAVADGSVHVWPIVGDEYFTRPTDDCLLVKCGDSYQHNSLKLRGALQWLLRLDNGVTHWFICDDDTFVHPQRWLAHEPQGDIEGRLYYPTADEAKRRGSDPWINGGAGWWMSRKMCELYVEHCHERTSGDDVVVARIAQQHGMKIIDRPDLYGDSRYADAPRIAADNSLITCHPVQPHEMEGLCSQVLAAS